CESLPALPPRRRALYRQIGCQLPPGRLWQPMPWWSELLGDARCSSIDIDHGPVGADINPCPQLGHDGHRATVHGETDEPIQILETAEALIEWSHSIEYAAVDQRRRSGTVPAPGAEILDVAAWDRDHAPVATCSALIGKGAGDGPARTRRIGKRHLTG